MDLDEILNICVKEEQYFGLGNANSNIMFVGKEAGTDKTSTEIYAGSAQSWKDKKYDYSKSFIPNEEKPDEKKLRNGNHTWQKYQKLYELIRTKLNLTNDFKRYEITFVENIFTTELSNLPARTTDNAKAHKDFKSNLEKRKKVFWESDFIKTFSVILLAACDNEYIEIYDGEVRKLFEVDFINECEIGKSKIWIHNNLNKENAHPKLVLHTRQLTNGASIDLLNKVAELIAVFLTEHSIPLEVRHHV